VIGTPRRLGLALGLLWIAPAAAQDASTSLFIAPLTGRETFLVIAIGAMMCCALASFALAGRVSERTQIGLALLVVLVGGFCLFMVFAAAAYAHPLGAVLLVALLIGLFKLMNQFESGRRPGGDKPPG
jgi:hypothetical protein